MGLFGGLIICGCDLQPKIMSLPDSVGDFISARYPALLADPVAQPEIYNSAATDYGVYAAPDLYGSASSDDYIMYSGLGDYMFPAQAAPNTTEVVAENASPASDDIDVAPEDSAPDDNDILTVPEYAAGDDVLSVPMYGGAYDSHEVTVARGDTIYSVARRYGTTVDEMAKLNNLVSPYSIRVGQKLRVPGNGDIKVAATDTPVPGITATPPTQVSNPSALRPAPRAATPAKVQLKSITVAPGDTLYSLSRKYSVPVNDLAVMNDLAAPFALTVGQKLKVPNLAAAAAAVAAAPVQAGGASSPSAPVRQSVAPKTASKPAPNKPVTQSGAKSTATKNTTRSPVKQEKPKISSDPKKQLPAIKARSSSKFSWPVRGKILSAYGAKTNGLFNDGINISASRGTAVKAAENGVVAYAGNEIKGMGNLIIVQHDGGWMTVYAHLDSIGLRRGARVAVGQKIGTVGATGKVDRPQLHFEIRKGTKAYNPAQYLKK